MGPLLQCVIERARPVSLLGANVRVASPEDLVLLKLLADRAQDRAEPGHPGQALR